MARAEDIGAYFRIPADNRALNYNQYFSQGTTKVSEIQDYTSHNTERLDVEGVKKLLIQLDIFKEVVHA